MQAPRDQVTKACDLLARGRGLTIGAVNSLARLLPLLLLSSLIFAGCAGDGDSPPTASPSASATAASPSAAASATGTGTGTATPTATGGTAEPGASPTPAMPSEPVTSTYFIATEDLPVVRFAPSGVELPVETPPRSEYSIGLSGRQELEGRGMLFVFTGDANRPGFWMLNTHIDLDIAFVDGAGRILHIATMRADTEEIHHPGEHYETAIEASAGWFAEQGIEVGDTVEYLFDLGAIAAD